MSDGGIGGRVSRTREALGWSVRALAQQSGLSHPMIAKIEAGTVNPSVEVLSRVAEALGVAKPWLFFGTLSDVQIVVSPSFVPSDEAARCKARTAGDHVVPEHGKYLDPDGCAAYLSLVSEPSYRAALEGAPLRELADAVQSLTGTEPLSLVCLGSGHARYEDRFLNLLLPRSKVHSVVCVDIAAALLIIGGRRICETLQSRQWVRSVFVYGDFLDMPWELALFPECRRVVTMFGYTYCNLERDDFLATLPLNRGDLVILDITLPADPPEADPGLHRSIDFRSRLFEFLTAPLHKLHRPDELSISSHIEPWRDCYRVNNVATATTGESYKVGHSKRISASCMATLAGSQYEIRSVHPYSELRAMVLLQRR